MDELEMLQPVFEHIEATSAAYAAATVITIRALPNAQRRRLLSALRRHQLRLRRRDDTHTANILRLIERSASRRRR